MSDRGRFRGWSVALAITIAMALHDALAFAQPAPQGWRPQRPVELMVGAAPGGSIDLTARVLQRTLDERKLVGVPTLVVNRPGAGQGLAWAQMIDRSKTVPAIAMGGPNLVSNPVTGLHPIDHTQVTTLAVLFDDYMAIAVRADSPIRSMREAIERLQGFRKPVKVIASQLGKDFNDQWRAA